MPTYFLVLLCKGVFAVEDYGACFYTVVIC